MSLEISDICVAFGEKIILDGLTIPAIEPGEVVSMIGRNGAGKSTLLRQMTKLLKKHPIKVLYAKEPLKLDNIGYLPQDHRITASITVLELLITTLNIDSNSLFVKEDSAQKSLDVLTEIDILPLANKLCTELSGGESQMVGLAQAVINKPKVLILDEPTAALDMKNQLKLLDYVKAFSKKHHACVLMVLHDLNLAIQYSDKVAALHNGKLLAFDEPVTLVTTELIKKIFQVKSQVVKVDDMPVVVVQSSQQSETENKI